MQHSSLMNGIQVVTADASPKRLRQYDHDGWDSDAENLGCLAVSSPQSKRQKAETSTAAECARAKVAEVQARTARLLKIERERERERGREG